MKTEGLRLKLPGTSANLGPGFDAAGLALSMHLTVEAHEVAAMSLEATGRDAAQCGERKGNLILDTYCGVLADAGVKAPKLRLRVHNEIPLGMGCGSSAAALLAGVALANHFGGLKLSDAQIVSEATRLEGHPDNVAACWHGGFTTSAQIDGNVEAATFAGDPAWRMLLAMPAVSLATTVARGLLPESYPFADAVCSVQRASLLVAAFAQQRLELLRVAMHDCLHQPYRERVCPLLKVLLPLAADEMFAGVALSGAGPSVLLFLAPSTTEAEAEARVRQLVPPETELLRLTIGGGVQRTVLG